MPLCAFHTSSNEVLYILMTRTFKVSLRSSFMGNEQPRGCETFVTCRYAMRLLFKKRSETRTGSQRTEVKSLSGCYANERIIYVYLIQQSFNAPRESQCIFYSVERETFPAIVRLL
jgi:hypothetical protein